MSFDERDMYFTINVVLEKNSSPLVAPHDCDHRSRHPGMQTLPLTSPPLSQLDIRYETLANTRTGLALDPASGHLYDAISGQAWKGVVALRTDEPAADPRYRLSIPPSQFFDLAKQHFAELKAAVFPDAGLERDLRTNDKLRARLQAIRLARLENAEKDSGISIPTLELKLAAVQKEYDDLRSEPVAVRDEQLSQRIDDLSTTIHQKQLQNIAMRQDLQRLERETTYAVTQSKSEALIEPLQRQLALLKDQLEKYGTGMAHLDQLEEQSRAFRLRATENAKERERVLKQSGYLPPSLVPSVEVQLGGPPRTPTTPGAARTPGREAMIDQAIAEAIGDRQDSFLLDSLVTIGESDVKQLEQKHDAPNPPPGGDPQLVPTLDFVSLSAIEYLVSIENQPMGRIGVVYLTGDQLINRELRYQTNLPVLAGPEDKRNLYDITIIAPSLEVIRKGPETDYLALESAIQVKPAVFFGVPNIRDDEKKEYLFDRIPSAILSQIWGHEFELYRANLPGQPHAVALDVLVIDVTVLRTKNLLTLENQSDFATSLVGHFQGYVRRIVLSTKARGPSEAVKFRTPARSSPLPPLTPVWQNRTI